MSTAKEKAYSRKYYKDNPKYRRKKIQQRKDYYRENQEEQNAYERKRYRTDPSYRKYKINYAKNYQKNKRKK